MSIRYITKSWLRHVANNTLGAIPRPMSDRAPDIMVFSNRRGGSTWLIELLSKEPEIKRALEIFDVTLNHNPYRSVLPEDNGGFFFGHSGTEKQKIFQYFDDISCGKKNYNTQWKFWAQPYSPKYRRMLFKLFYVKNYIEDFHRHYDNHLILQLRHPIPTAMSISRLGWPTAIDSMGKDANFRNGLSSEQVKTIDDVLDKGTLLERHIVGWFLENYIAMNYAIKAELLVLTYEQMVLNPEATLDLLSERLDLRLPDSALQDYRKPSYNAFDSADRLVSSTPEELCSGWRAKFDQDENGLTPAIFDAFKNPFYSIEP